MGSAYITKRGRSYVVRFRRGGRDTTPEHAGSFRTLREARIRRDLIGGEIAACRDPRALLDAFMRPSTILSQSLTFADWATKYLDSRVDLRASSLRAYGERAARLNERFGALDPMTITHDDVQQWVVETKMKPTSLRKYHSLLCAVLDYALPEGHPNPARSKKVSLPRGEAQEANPPSSDQFRALLTHLPVPRRWALPVILQEQVGTRGHELAELTWGDVDVVSSRFRVTAAVSKTRFGRWVSVPQWLMDEVEATVPFEERSVDRRVFPGLNPSTMRNVLWRACKAAGITNFSPHDLRHRRLSLWHLQGVPAREVAERSGHRRTSTSLDFYSHVNITSDEVSSAELLLFLRNAVAVSDR
jgi:integrase